MDDCYLAREDVVTIEWFSKVLEWFGPFTLDSKFIDNTTKTVSIKCVSNASYLYHGAH